MSSLVEFEGPGNPRLDRRSWLLRAASGGALLGAIAESIGRGERLRRRRKAPPKRQPVSSSAPRAAYAPPRATRCNTRHQNITRPSATLPRRSCRRRLATAR